MTPDLKAQQQKSPAAQKRCPAVQLAPFLKRLATQPLFS